MDRSLSEDRKGLGGITDEGLWHNTSQVLLRKSIPPFTVIKKGINLQYSEKMLRELVKAI